MKERQENLSINFPAFLDILMKSTYNKKKGRRCRIWQM